MQFKHYYYYSVSRKSSAELAQGLAELWLAQDTSSHKQFLPNIFILQGDLGAGKTTFVHDFLIPWKVEDVHSPTFSLVHEYPLASLSKGSEAFFLHADLYRLESPKEIFSLGLDERVREAKLSFIEWPKNVEQLFSYPCLFLSIFHLPLSEEDLFSEFEDTHVVSEVHLRQLRKRLLAEKNLSEGEKDSYVGGLHELNYTKNKTLDECQPKTSEQAIIDLSFSSEERIFCLSLPATCKDVFLEAYLLHKGWIKMKGSDEIG